MATPCDAPGLDSGYDGRMHPRPPPRPRHTDHRPEPTVTTTLGSSGAVAAGDTFTVPAAMVGKNTLPTRETGPSAEKWALANFPGASAEDVAAARAENAADLARAPGSASPVHLVVERMTRARLARIR